MKLTFLLLIFSIFHIGSDNELNVKTELKNLEASYKKNDPIWMLLTYTSYSDSKTTVPLDVLNGDYLINKDNYKHKINEILTVKNSKYVFTVDPKNKILLVADQNTRKNTPVFSTDSLLKSAIECHVKQENSKTRSIEAIYNQKYISGNSIERVKVFYSSQSFLMSKMILYYAREMKLDNTKPDLSEKPRLEIIFERKGLPKLIEKDIFSEKEYFDVMNDQIVLTEKLKNYSISDQRILKKP